MRQLARVDARVDDQEVRGWHHAALLGGGEAVLQGGVLREHFGGKRFGGDTRVARGKRVVLEAELAHPNAGGQVGPRVRIEHGAAVLAEYGFVLNFLCGDVERDVGRDVVRVAGARLVGFGVGRLVCGGLA